MVWCRTILIIFRLGFVFSDLTLSCRSKLSSYSHLHFPLIQFAVCWLSYRIWSAAVFPWCLAPHVVTEIPLSRMAVVLAASGHVGPRFDTHSQQRTVIYLETLNYSDTSGWVLYIICGCFVTSMAQRYKVLHSPDGNLWKFNDIGWTPSSHTTTPPPLTS